MYNYLYIATKERTASRSWMIVEPASDGKLPSTTALHPDPDTRGHNKSMSALKAHLYTKLRSSMYGRRHKRSLSTYENTTLQRRRRRPIERMPQNRRPGRKPPKDGNIHSMTINNSHSQHTHINLPVFAECIQCIVHIPVSVAFYFVSKQAVMNNIDSDCYGWLQFE